MSESRWPRVLAVFVGAGLLLFTTGHLPAAAAEENLSGEVLDMACFIPKGAKGPAHRKCALTCAEHGMPLGLLTDDDKVYLLYPKHGKEKAFDAVKLLAGSRAVLKGKASERMGISGFEVHSATAPE